VTASGISARGQVLAWQTILAGHHHEGAILAALEALRTEHPQGGRARHALIVELLGALLGLFLREALVAVVDRVEDVDGLFDVLPGDVLAGVGAALIAGLVRHVAVAVAVAITVAVAVSIPIPAAASRGGRQATAERGEQSEAGNIPAESSGHGAQQRHGG
jgi:hypothetical protein